MVREEKGGADLERLLLNRTRLAILLLLAVAQGPVTLTQVERALEIPRQTAHAHLEVLVNAGVVEKARVFSNRPRVIYAIRQKAVEELLRALRRIRARIELLEEAFSPPD